MAKQTGISIRAVIVLLKSPLGRKSTAEIADITGVSTSQINRIYAKAIDRGFDPYRIPFTLEDEWLQNTPGAGRPRKKTAADDEDDEDDAELPPDLAAAPELDEKTQDPPSGN